MKARFWLAILIMGSVLFIDGCARRENPVDMMGKKVDQGITMSDVYRPSSQLVEAVKSKARYEWIGNTCILMVVVGESLYGGGGEISTSKFSIGGLLMIPLDIHNQTDCHN